MNNGRFYRPRSLLLQWHITDRCNLRCKHCYQETNSLKELTFQDLLDVYRQFQELLDFWNQDETLPMTRGHITVTGGEPFIRHDFMDLLEFFSAQRQRISYAVLTNGSFIDAEMAHRLHDLTPTFVQVSIDGTQATHDRIRGVGDFKRVISAVKHLVRERVPTFISFTAHRANFREFADVANLGMRLRVDRVWADRFIPLGRGLESEYQVLNPDETREFFEIMYRARRKAKRSLFCRTEIAMHRALQFLVAGGIPHHCTAGDTLITVMPNGDLYPCRRMPIRAGNLVETPLIKLYYKSDLFCALRKRISEGCEGCFYSGLCRGGLRCLSYALTGDPFTTDPGCWQL
uniref:PqqA peptide cyclase n=1 Tax=Candidatus Methanogaster sp. ANME-2c ERB4 TaxID=2759911 RepID=A0A7G9YQ09_9EURY|nr:PqqA peptide cyclase [Methanosarcinales archaeon ANME-2c ERB4]